MDGLSTIKPEIEEFVSRENRSHRDPCLQQAVWIEHERTLTLHVHTTCSTSGASERQVAA